MTKMQFILIILIILMILCVLMGVFLYVMLN